MRSASHWHIIFKVRSSDGGDDVGVVDGLVDWDNGAEEQVWTANHLAQRKHTHVRSN